MKGIILSPKIKIPPFENNYEIPPVTHWLSAIEKAKNRLILEILNYKQAKKDFFNYFHNNNGNSGINIMNQGSSISQNAEVQNLKDELLESERKRIAFLEALLKNNSIDF